MDLETLKIKEQTIRERVDKIHQSIKDSEEELEDYQVLLTYTQKVVEDKLLEVREKIEPLVNKALTTIFVEDDYTFRFDSKIVRDKTTYIPLIIDNNSKTQGTIDSFGGGVNVITSLLLRVLFIILSEKRRFIVLDESLNQLSPIYRERTAEFLKNLCKELDFTILLINFDENNDYSKYADRVYEAYRYSEDETRFRSEKK